MRFGAARDDGFAAFVASATPSLSRTAWLLTGDRDAAAELLQSALVKAYLAWPRIDPATAEAYTRRIMANQRTDTWRSRRREVLTDAVPEAAKDGGYDGADDRDTILRLLARLPDRQRAVVVLRYYHDYSEADTAATLGISVGAVKSAASRGLALVRSQVASGRGDPGHRPEASRSTTQAGGSPTSAAHNVSPKAGDRS